jgi:hypothetical protein
MPDLDLPKNENWMWANEKLTWEVTFYK